MKDVIKSQYQKEEENRIMKDLNCIIDQELIQKLDFFATQLLKVQDLDLLGKQLYRRVKNKIISDISHKQSQDAYILRELIKKIDSANYCYKIFLPIIRKYQSANPQVYNHRSDENIDWTRRSSINQLFKNIKVQQNDEIYIQRSQFAEKKFQKQDKYQEQYNKLINSNVSYHEKLDIIQNYPVSSSRLQKYGQNKVKVTFTTDCIQDQNISDINIQQHKQTVHFKDKVQLTAYDRDDDVVTSYKVHTRLSPQDNEKIITSQQKQVHYYNQTQSVNDNESKQNQIQNIAPRRNDITNYHPNIQHSKHSTQNSNLITSHNVKQSLKQSSKSKLEDNINQQNNIIEQDQVSQEESQEEDNEYYNSITKKIILLKKKSVCFYLKMNNIILTLNQTKQIQMQNQMSLNVKLEQIYEQIQQKSKIKLNLQKKAFKQQFTKLRERILTQQCTLSNVSTLFQSVREQHIYKVMQLEEMYVLYQEMQRNVSNRKLNTMRVDQFQAHSNEIVSKNDYGHSLKPQQKNSTEDISRALQDMENFDALK